MTKVTELKVWAGEDFDKSYTLNDPTIVMGGASKKWIATAGYSDPGPMANFWDLGEYPPLGAPGPRSDMSFLYINSEHVDYSAEIEKCHDFAIQING